MSILSLSIVMCTSCLSAALFPFSITFFFTFILSLFLSLFHTLTLTQTHRRLLDYNQQRMPFAAAQIGTGFRNEIAPRNGLLRVREFCMAEIEHFVHPEHKEHPRFKEVATVELCLFPREQQLTTGRTVSMSIAQAVTQVSICGITSIDDQLVVGVNG